MLHAFMYKTLIHVKLIENVNLYPRGTKNVKQHWNGAFIIDNTGFILLFWSTTPLFRFLSPHIALCKVPHYFNPLSCLWNVSLKQLAVISTLPAWMKVKRLHQKWHLHVKWGYCLKDKWKHISSSCNGLLWGLDWSSSWGDKHLKEDKERLYI